MSRLFLTFVSTTRLAISDGLDQDQPFYVGVPSWLPLDNDNFGRTYFFVRVEDAYEKTALPEVTATGLPPVTEGVAVEDISLAVSSRHSLDTAHESGHSSSSGSRRGSGDVAFSSSGTRSSSSISKSRSRSGTASASSSCSVVSGTVWLPRGPNGPMGCPIEGLVLGPLVGKGAYGRVYRGVYQGAPVAVKVREGCTLCAPRVVVGGCAALLVSMYTCVGQHSCSSVILHVLISNDMPHQMICHNVPL